MLTPSFSNTSDDPDFEDTGLSCLAIWPQAEDRIYVFNRYIKVFFTPPVHRYQLYYL